MRTVTWDRFTRRTWSRRNNNGSDRNGIAVGKARVLAEFGAEVGEHSRLLRLALNEAEALAWHSGFPQLFFQELAAEKALAVVRWSKQQREVRRKALEFAFAE